MKALKIIAVLLVATFLYYKFAYPTYTYRYRMTAEVETPEGLKTGSSVVQITTKQWPEWLRGLAGGHIENTKVKGEGIAIEVVDGKTLFVLLEMKNYRDHAKYMLAYTFPIKKYDWSDIKADVYIRGESKTREGIKYYATLKNAKEDLPEAVYPAMVTAITGNDGQVEIKELNPRDMSIFGKEVTLRRIIIETTNDPLESKIKDLPIWLKVRDYILSKKIEQLYYVVGGAIKG